MRVPAYLAIALAVSHLSSCYPNGAPSQGEHDVPITFQHWLYSGACAAANVSMWVRYAGTAQASSQSDIINFARAHYPSQVGPDDSFSVSLIEQLLRDYSFISTTDNFYTGEDQKRHAVADIKKSILSFNPTIVITDAGLHAKLVTGGSWTQLPDYQPDLEYFRTADPQDYAFRSDTVGYWIQQVGVGDPSGTYIRAIGIVGQYGSGSSALAEFDSWGGTYYGDPHPPHGCDDCRPEVDAMPKRRSWHALLRWVQPFFANTVSEASTGGVAPLGYRTIKTDARLTDPGVEQRFDHPVRRFVYVPRPHATSARDVIENLMAGLRQTHLRNVSGWEDLDDLLTQTSLAVVSVEQVSSLTMKEPYWLLTLGTGGRPFAKALVSETGWLLSVMRAEGGHSVRIPVSLETAHAWAKNLGYVHESVRRVHMNNNMTAESESADYNPFFEITSPGKMPVFVSEDGAAFIADPTGDRIGFWSDGAHRFRRIN